VQEKPSSPVVAIVVIVLAVLGCGAALFGAKVWYDKRKLGTTSKSGREKAYAMKDEDHESSNN